MRLRLRLRGRVQGVGMRPHVVRLAEDLFLSGAVGNDVHGVWIEVEGPPAAVATFGERLVGEAPPLARIAAVERGELPSTGAFGFVIAPSGGGGVPEFAIAPDAKVCSECLRDVREPGDRRHRYPFTTCTNCGPRYSIIRDVPYDRPTTTMAGFPLCPACAHEYGDVRDRRHHAQPVACPACGPRLRLVRGEAVAEGDLALRAAVAALAGGAIVAIKGLGGWHLACRADDEAVVARLRERKRRESKPFALLVRDPAGARALVVLDPAAAAAMAAPPAPIVLAPRRPNAPVAPSVAPDTDLLGVMLPSTPLHQLLMDDLAAQRVAALVLTSGNRAGEPLEWRDEVAGSEMAAIADAILGHDRPIARPVDDSVVIAMRHGVVPVRRARGFVPDPIAVGVRAPTPILAAGGDLKAALCFLSGDEAVLSEHLGDLEHPAAFRAFTAAAERLGALLRVRPTAVACDLHPAYHSARWARGLGLPVIAVQHHHAHVAAAMAEHGLRRPVIGLACDGTGYGDDGAVWGGEVLWCDGPSYRRVGHLAPFPLLGGDGAARETWRSAAGILARAGVDWRALPAFAGIAADARDLHAQRLADGRGTPCTSLGRILDAAACVLGVADRNGHEAAAAMALEAAAQRAHHPAEGLPAIAGLDVAPLLLALAGRRAAGEPPGPLALAFHLAVAEALADAAADAARAAGVADVVLTGGCFLNRLLTAACRTRLSEHGLTPWTHRLVPPGDGGLALGQAVVAAWRLGQQQQQQQ